MQDSAPHYRKAKKFYDALATELVNAGHSLDVFVCALDQARPYKPSSMQQSAKCAADTALYKKASNTSGWCAAPISCRQRVSASISLYVFELGATQLDRTVAATCWMSFRAP